MPGILGKKAVLVYPRFDQDTWWSFHRSLKKFVAPTEFGTAKRTHPPLGLLGLYRYLKPYYNEIVLIDRNIDPRPLIDLLKGADHVFISAMVSQKESFLKDAEIVKQAKIPLIVGGPIVDEELKGSADILVQGEAEMVLPDVIKDLRKKRYGTFYKGTHPPPEMFLQPDFSAINPYNYINMSIQTSRGCPHNCEFCGLYEWLGHTPRYTPEKHVKAALKQLFELGWREAVFIVDDNFIGNPAKAVKLVKDIYKFEQKLGFHFPKYTELTKKLAEDNRRMKELRSLFHKTNFNNFFVGVETINEASLKESSKYQNITKGRSTREELTHISEETGAGVMMGIIHGFDNDTRKSVEPLSRFINASNSPIITAGLLVALPRTRLHRRLSKEGRLFAACRADNSDGTINFIPNKFSAEQAEKDYIKLIQNIFDEDAFFARVMRELQLLDPVLGPKQNVKTDNWQTKFHALFSREVSILLRHSFQAHGVAWRRAREKGGFNLKLYSALMAAYFAHCARYVHLKGHTDFLAEQQKKRKYKPWQKYSWQELLASPSLKKKVLASIS